MLGERIDDRAFLGLIRKWLKAGILDTDGQVLHPDTGTPQGGIVSPVLANVYLHYALDLWFERVVKPHCRGKAMLCRYADDFVCAFASRRCRAVLRVLPKRLEKFGLQVAPEKTQARVLQSRATGPEHAHRLPRLRAVLAPHLQGAGAAHAPDRAQATATRHPEHHGLDQEPPAPAGQGVHQGLNRRLIGHYNYYGLRGNRRPVAVPYRGRRAAFKWLNRRGGKRKSYTWDAFKRALQAARRRPSPHHTQSQLRNGNWCLHDFHARAKASTTEEPDAGKPHVRVCGGGSG
jgi:RNA-directed DNA polymerase